MQYAKCGKLKVFTYIFGITLLKIFFFLFVAHTGDWLELKLNFAQFKNNALGDLSRKLITTTKNNLFSDCPINAIGVLGFVTMSGNIENLR